MEISVFLWTLLCNDGLHLNSFVRNRSFLPSSPELFSKGRAKNKLFGTKAFRCCCLALRIDFDNLKRNSQAGFSTSLSGLCPVCHSKGVYVGFLPLVMQIGAGLCFSPLQ